MKVTTAKDYVKRVRYVTIEITDEDLANGTEEAEFLEDLQNLWNAYNRQKEATNA